MCRPGQHIKWAGGAQPWSWHSLQLTDMVRIELKALLTSHADGPSVSPLSVRVLLETKHFRKGEEGILITHYSPVAWGQLTLQKGGLLYLR